MMANVADEPWHRVASLPLPKEVRRIIALYDGHPVADMVRGLKMSYEAVPYEPLSLFLVVECAALEGFVRGRPNRVYWEHRWRKVYWLCRSRYRADHNELPDWVVRSFDSTDE